ncbi:MAG: hypothetical protein BCS36_05270 [Desulfovibrio sp. MES5]|nr:MAG: hypothetical protein BCS36_05270 [Desulfovibrio sp. MES5]
MVDGDAFYKQTIVNCKYTGLSGKTLLKLPLRLRQRFTPRGQAHLSVWLRTAYPRGCGHL